MYQIGEQIGRGAIGVVYKGLNVEDAKIVAIKQIALPNLREDEKKAIKMEINLLKKLKHENIVKYIDYIATENHLNIVLEFVDSGSLQSIIKKFGPFPESLVAIYIKQVLTGLDYLHSQGVVHRDIKGANILTTREGVVKLADFGVATKLGEPDKTASIVGTPYWMAPEIIEMRGHVSTSCDIWSLGCTVIELLTGNPPYWDLPQYSALFKIVHDDHPPIPTGVSDLCKDFMLKCFQKEPMLRIDAKGLLKHPWIRSQSQDIYEVINSHENQLPEEVHNTIRLHIDKQGNIYDMSAMPHQYGRDEHTDYNSEEEEEFAKGETGRVVRDSHHNHNNLDSSNKGDGNMGLENNGTDNESPRMMTSGRYYQEKENDRNAKNSQRYRMSDSVRNSKLDYHSHGSKNNNDTIGNFDANLYDRRLGQYSRFNTLDDGSFVSHDHHRDTLTNTVVADQYKISPSKLAPNGTGNPLAQSISKRDYRFIKEMSELMSQIFVIHYLSVNKITDEERLEKLKRLTQIVKEFTGAKNHFMKEFGISNLMDLIENEQENTELLLATLQLLNQLVDSDAKMQEQACNYGILPTIIKLTHAEYARDIRVEAAYFLGQLVYASQSILQIFIAAGGFKALVELMDLNYEENKDLICLAIDCLIVIFDTKGLLPEPHLCKILFKLGIFKRLLIIINNLSYDKDVNMADYLVKAVDMMIRFAKPEDAVIRNMMCEDEILPILLIYIAKFEQNQPLLFKLIKVLKFISCEPSVLNKLESFGIIQTVINLITKYIKSNVSEIEEATSDLVKILFFMSKLNLKRQEQIAQLGGIGILINICKIFNKSMKKIAFPILLSFCNTSPETRKKLWEYGGPKIYLDHLDDDNFLPKILDTIAAWLSYEPLEIENVLLEYQTFNKLMEIFKGANKATFMQIVPIYGKLISLSDKLNVKLGKNFDFLEELVERLDVEELEMNHKAGSNGAGEAEKTAGSKIGYYGGAGKYASYTNNVVNKKKVKRMECQNPSALVRKEIMGILLQLCSKHSNPRELLNTHNLYPVILQILQNDKMVILEVIATQILHYYSGQIGTPIRKDYQ